MPKQEKKDYMNNEMTFPAQRTLQAAITRIMTSIRSLGPYLAIELIMPGGSIIALVLWTYRNPRAARGSLNKASTAVVSLLRRVPLRCPTSCTQP